jgi:hypothetical protein
MDPGFEPKHWTIAEKLIDDFYFVHTEGVVHVCHVPLPAATASLAIDKYNVQLPTRWINLAAAS